MALEKSTFLASFGVFLLFMEDCDGSNRTYYSSKYYDSQINPRDKLLSGVIVSFISFILSVCVCCWIFSGCRNSDGNRDENAGTDEVASHTTHSPPRLSTQILMHTNSGGSLVYSNPQTQQRIETSTASTGVHYPTQSYTSNSTVGLHYPSQLYPCSGQFNTDFQYGMETPNQLLDAAAPPPYEDPAPSYESVFGRATCPSHRTHENNLNLTDPPPYKSLY
ncbi:uncharacterized protein LOC133204667 [Saccostrea echinata]|uniref:uncharacterized protein LOC133204667 n=1 Tax=Saccostrea echinata TaxID=191078 RepID=UPI002A7F778B|nr:uncharacterized protein LOC133204667 [Saccostrea echinata]